MHYFSSFTGAGGFDLAVPEDWQRVGFSEIDKYANMVLRYRFPDVKNYGDINAIKWEEVPDFEVLFGGTPCQDLSLAGKRKGLAGERSGLLFKFVEALKAKKPEYFVWENVKGALSSNQGWDFAEVLNQFSEAGYRRWWQVLNAKHFGVPQNRERIFIVGFRDRSPPEVFFEPENGNKNNEEGAVVRTFTAGGHSGGLHSNSTAIIVDSGGTEGQTPRPQEVVPALTATYYKGDTAKHYAERGNRTLILNNKVLKLSQEAKPIEIAKNKSISGRVYSPIGIAISLKANGGGLGVKTGLYAVQAVLTPDREKKRQNVRRFKNSGEPMFTLTGQDIHGIKIIGNIYPSGGEAGKVVSSEGIYPTVKQGKRGGAAGLPPIAIIHNMQPTSPNRTSADRGGSGHLTKTDGTTYTIDTGNTNAVQLDNQIRRLTPRECERLMSWPDDWTRWGTDEKGNKIEISDTQRYKMAGNGVVSNVVKWLIENVILRDNDA